MPLYRSTSSDRNQSSQPSILPYGTWRAKGNPRVPMVCCRTAKNRLETRMDRSYTTPSDIACQRRKESRLRTLTKEYPSREKGRQLFPGRIIFHLKRIPAAPVGGIPSKYQRHKKVFSEEE